MVSNKYKVPPEFSLCSPRAEERAHAPPPGYAAIYTQHLGHELKLPPQPFVASVLAHYEITLGQLHPKGMFFILGFLEICRKTSVSPTLALFRYFFVFQKSQHKYGWYTFRSIPPRILHAPPRSAYRWKASFLFFKTAPITEDLDLSWNDSPIMDPPVVDKPSSQAINMILAYVQSSSMHQNPLEQAAFAPKSCSSINGIMKAAGEMPAKKASIENAILKPSAASTESPSAACRLERLKRKAEFDATKQAKTLRAPTLDQLATYNQKCFCSLHSQLQGDVEELEKHSCR